MLNICVSCLATHVPNLHHYFKLFRLRERAILQDISYIHLNSKVGIQGQNSPK